MSDRLIGVDEGAIEQNFDDGQKETILRIVEDTENGITHAVDNAVADKLKDEKLLLIRLQSKESLIRSLTGCIASGKTTALFRVPPDINLLLMT